MANQPGDSVSVVINQGTREALVLARLPDGSLLVEYEMPKGTTGLQEIRGIYTRGLGYRALPVYWLRAVVAGGQSWIANPQQGRLPVPSPQELLEYREQKV